MATYDYEVVGFPTNPVAGDILQVGTSEYIYSDKGTWDASRGAQGPQGVQGEQGEQGLQGDSGSAGKGGYELTGGFTDRTTGTAGASDIGTDVEYTQAMVDSETWLRFGLGTTAQLANDKPYWSNGGSEEEAAGAIYSADANNLPSGFSMVGGNAYPDSYQGTGLFSGEYMPEGASNLFAFGESTSYNNESTSGTKYNAAEGSYRMDELKVGDFCQFRFDFNLTPQFANTTVEVGLIWQTRDAVGNPTFTFALTGEPLFYGAGTTGRTFLNRPIMTAYLASEEDVNARALPAIRSDQPIFVQPLTTLFRVGR